MTGYEEDIKALGLLTALAAFASVVFGAMSAYLHFDWMPVVSFIVCFVLNALALLYGATTIICFIFVLWSIGSHCREHRLIVRQRWPELTTDR